MNQFFPLILVLLACACAAPRPTVVDKGTPSIYLRAPVTMTIKDGAQSTVQLPAGEYVPDFKTSAGIYYRAPSRVVFVIRAEQTPREAASGSAKLSATKLAKGGVFIPFVPEHLHGAWADIEGVEDGTGSWIQQPTHVMPFTSRIDYHTSK